MHSNVLLLGLSLAFLGAPLVAAQALDPDVSISAATPARIELGPEGTATFRVVVSNGGRGDATIDMGFTGPAGWTATAAPDTFPLAGQGVSADPTSRDVVVTVKTGPHAAGVQNGSLVVTAAWTGGTPQTNGSPSTQVTLAYLAPAAPAPAPPPEPTPWGAILGSVFGGLFLIGGVAYVGQSRRVEIKVAQAQQPITVGCDGVYNVVVRNPTRKACTVELRVKELPIDWFAAFSFPKVALAPKESTVVPLLVRVPWSAPAGALGQVTFQARPNAHALWLRAASVRANVIDVTRPAASPPGYAA